MAFALAQADVVGGQTHQVVPSVPPVVNREPQTVEITGSASDAAQRRDFVAGKIVIGRKTIENSGLTTVQELLKREPSVTVSANGRLGLLGLPGYTQVLVDGVAPPAGRSPLETDLVHVDRIEIVKGALAEFGPYGVAGTINIVTRKVDRTSGETLRLGAIGGSSSLGASFAWSSSKAGRGSEPSVTHRASGRSGHENTTSTITSALAPPDGIPMPPSRRDERARSVRTQLSVATALSWKPRASTELSFEPDVLGLQLGQRGEEVFSAASLGSNMHAASRSEGQLAIASLALGWKEGLADGARLRVLLSASRSFVRRHALRDDHLDVAHTRRREHSRQEVHAADHAKVEYSASIAGGHDIKIGVNVGETSQNLRLRAASNGVNDDVLARVFGDRRIVHQRRLTSFIQDDWRVDKQLALNLGLTHEWRRVGMEEGTARAGNTISILAPSARLAWKLDEKGRRKLRASVSRTFSAPSLEQLGSRPIINPLAACPLGALCDSNSIEYPDSTGNPGLQAERALGFTISYEHYAGKDTVFSIDLFTRRIRDLIGAELTREEVSWASAPRYVVRPVNLGRARSTGFGLDARIHTRDVWPAGPKLELRGGVTVAKSSVFTVPGPDNRLVGQSPSSAKFGGRYSLHALPLELGIDASWLPSAWLRSEVAKRTWTGHQRDVELQAAWTISPTAKWRGALTIPLVRDRLVREELTAIDATVLRSIRKSSERRLTVNLELKL